MPHSGKQSEPPEELSACRRERTHPTDLGDILGHTHTHTNTCTHEGRRRKEGMERQKGGHKGRSGEKMGAAEGREGDDRKREGKREEGKSEEVQQIRLCKYCSVQGGLCV